MTEPQDQHTDAAQDAPQTETTDAPRRSPWFAAAIALAIVGALGVVVMLAAVYVATSLHSISDPAESVQLNELKARLAADPKNEELKTQIRRLDLRLRLDYFRSERFATQATFVLFASAIVGLVGLRWAAACSESGPAPPEGKPVEGRDRRMAMLGRVATGALVLVMLGGVAFAVVRFAPSDWRIADDGNPAPDGNGGHGPAVDPEPPWPAPEAFAVNWARFRGPGGQGVWPGDVPTEWDAASDKNIRWKTPVELPGMSSPVVWEGKVFLTGGNADERAVFCFEADGGKLLWKRSISTPAGGTIEDLFEDTGYAASTPCTDGTHLYAIFANGDLAALDYDGNVVWSRGLGTPENMYGYASSLTMHEGKLLVLFDQGMAGDTKSRLYALDRMTGKTVWEVQRDMGASWATPIVIEADKRSQIITCGNPWVIAYGTSDGKQLWKADVLTGDVAPSPVYAPKLGLLYTVNAGAWLAAIRPNGSGDVTESHVAWKGEQGLPDTGSPVTDGTFVLLVDSGGYATCYDAKEGKMLWEQELGQSTYVSPSLAGGRFYQPTRSDDGTTYVFTLNNEGIKIVAENALGEPIDACPAFGDGRIYLRGHNSLFCIEAK